MGLMNHSTKHQLPLTLMGAKTVEGKSKKTDFVKPLSAISILVNYWGVCDIILHTSSTSSSGLSANNSDCKLGGEGVLEYKASITPEVPLVGFHSRANDSGLVKLGLIMVDTLTAECKVSNG